MVSAAEGFLILGSLEEEEDVTLIQRITKIKGEVILKIRRSVHICSGALWLFLCLSVSVKMKSGLFPHSLRREPGLQLCMLGGNYCDLNSYYICISLCFVAAEQQHNF